jgi:hypothetical protein
MFTGTSRNIEQQARSKAQSSFSSFNRGGGWGSHFSGGGFGDRFGEGGGFGGRR